MRFAAHRLLSYAYLLKASIQWEITKFDFQLILSESAGKQNLKRDANSTKKFVGKQTSVVTLTNLPKNIQHEIQNSGKPKNEMNKPV